MPSETEIATSSSKGMVWTGRIISALVALLMIFSAIMKFLKPAAIVQSFTHFGYPENLIIGIGIVEIACVFVYLIPRTSVLGAILVTGYLGGATATNLRVGDPAFPAPVVLGVLAWAGLYLRDERIRKLIPFKRG